MAPPKGPAVERADKEYMKNKKGYTLIEILMVLTLIGIVSGIATVSYRGYNFNIQERDLKLSGKLFANAVKNCIGIVGGWSVIRSDGTTITPCKADDTAELKSKLSFTCPPDATCDVHTQNSYKYYCLSISKTVSGKKLQVLTRIPYNNPTDYQIWCGQVSAYLTLGGKTCKKSPGWTPAKPPGQTTPPPRVKLQDKGFEKGCANFK